MKYIVDRFEGEYVVCEAENANMVRFSKRIMPSDLKEGDVVIIDGDAVMIDRIETEKRKKNIEKLAEDLWN